MAASTMANGAPIVDMARVHLLGQADASTQVSLKTIVVMVKAKSLTPIVQSTKENGETISVTEREPSLGSTNLNTLATSGMT